MDSQHLNALSLQSLYYIADTKMHEIDLECLSTLPQTLRALQTQLAQLQGTPAPAPQVKVAVEEEEPEIEIKPQPTFSRRPAREPAALSAS